MLNKTKYLVIIMILTIAVSGCSILNDNEDPRKKDLESEMKEKELSTSIEELTSQKLYGLKIKQANNNYYPTTEDFMARLLEELENYQSVEEQMTSNKDFNLALKFNGFQDVLLDTESGYFRFQDTQQIYQINNWNSELWSRYILKEIDGQVKYYSYEKDVLARDYIGLYDKSEADEVLLYYDGDIRLKIKGEEISVLQNIPEEWIESLLASNQITNHLYIKENKEKQFLMVGSTYSHTSNYGSTSWLSCYRYDGGGLEEIWSMDNVLNSTIIVKDYEENNVTLAIKEQGKDFKITLTKDEMNRINNDIKELNQRGEEFIGKEEYFYFVIMPTYQFFDYNNDGNEELITTVYMKGESLGITEVVYFIYDFTDEGIKLKDILTARENINFDI